MPIRDIDLAGPLRLAQPIPSAFEERKNALTIGSLSQSMAEGNLRLQQLTENIKESKRKADEEQAVKEIVSAGGDPQEIYQELLRVNPDKARAYLTNAQADIMQEQQQALLRAKTLEGQPAREVPAPDMAVQQMPIPANLEGAETRTPPTQMMPPQDATPLPLPTVDVPFIGQPSTRIQPQSAQQLSLAKRKELEFAARLEAQKEAAKAAASAQAKTNEPYTLNPGDQRMQGSQVIAEGGQKTDVAPHTITTAEGVMQYEPGSKTWFKIGDRPPSQAGAIFNLNNPAQDETTVKFIADQVRDNPLNWNLTGGNKKLQGQVRQELAKGDDVNRLTAATRQLGETADSIVPKIEATIHKLDNPKFVANLGPVMGRWNEFLTGEVGTNDPELAQVRATLSLIQTGTMRAHVGARGSEGLLDKFEGLVDGKKMDAATLKGSLTGIRDFLQGYRDRIHQGGGMADTPIELERGPDGKLREKAK